MKRDPYKTPAVGDKFRWGVRDFVISDIDDTVYVRRTDQTGRKIGQRLAVCLISVWPQVSKGIKQITAELEKIDAT